VITIAWNAQGLVEPLIPPGKRGGGKRTVIMREVVNGLMYILSTGCQWRAIPKDLPPKSSVYGYFDLWTYDGTLERIHHALYERCRDREQREACVAAPNIDPFRRPTLTLVKQKIPKWVSTHTAH